MTWGNALSVLALVVSVAAAYFAHRAAQAAERANHFGRLNALFDLQAHYQAQLKQRGEFASSLPGTVGGRAAEQSAADFDTKIREVAREIDKYHDQVVCSHD